MAEKVTRKKFIKRSAAAVGTASLVGYGMYKLLEVKSSDELYGEYPAESFKTRLAVNPVSGRTGARRTRAGPSS